MSLSLVPDMSIVCLWMGRLLMLGMFLVLVASPYTECAWRWDGFPRGGSDFELGLVACAAMICLALVVALQAKGTLAHRVSLLLRRTGWMWGAVRPGLFPRLSRVVSRTRWLSPASPPTATPLKI